jgi:hypothetical protein
MDELHTIDLPVTEDQAGQIMHTLSDPDQVRHSLLIQFGTESAQGRWSAFAVRREHGPDGLAQCWASFEWTGRD